MTTTAYPLGAGVEALRKEVIDSVIKQTASRSYKFKQAVAVVPTSANKNTFFRENLEVSTGPSGNKFKGIPRGANFPQSDTEWQEVTVRILKFGSEVNIPWEDIISNDINVMARSIIRRTEEVVKAVDDYIWDELTQEVGAGSSQDIGSFSLVKHWDESSAAIVDDIKRAAEIISTTGNYATDNLLCFISPRDERSIMNYIADKGAQWTAPATNALRNGEIGKIAGVTFIASNSVEASYALVVKPKTCATYNQLVSIRSTTVEDPYKSTMIRVVEQGSISLTDPKAIVLIKGTQSPNA